MTDSPAETPYLLQAYNRFLEHIRPLLTEESLPTEQAMSDAIGVSRFTLRKILRRAADSGIVRWKGRDKRLLRRIRKSDFVENPPAETSKRETVIRHVTDAVTAGEIKPGDHFSETRIARETGTTLGTVRDALPRVAELGIIRKEERRQWEVVAIDDRVIEELMDFRELLEIAGTRAFCDLPEDDPAWERLRQIRSDHEKLPKTPDRLRKRFREVDGALHHLILEATRNRYITAAFDSISLLILLQRERLRLDEERLRLGFSQHLAIIDALLEKDRRSAVSATRTHMRDARKTLAMR